MKFIARKSLLAIAAGMTLASSAFAQTAPSVTLYGRMDLAIESANDGALTKTMLQNYASRFGIKGERSFSSDLSGIFQVETGIAPDDTAQSKTLASRNSFVGLKSSSAGTFLAGTYDTPLKMLDAGGYAGTLYGQGEAMEVIIHGKGTATVNPTAATFDNVHTRQKNNLVYISPKFADFVAKASYSPDEGQTATVTTGTVSSASLEWNNGTYNAGIATQQKSVVTASTSTAAFGMSATKLTFGAKMDNMSGAIVLSSLDNQATLANNARKTTNTLLVLNYASGPMTYKFNYGMSGESASNAKDDLSMLALEAAYSLDKQTTVYGSYAQITNNASAKGEFVGSDNKVTPLVGNDPTALTFGIRYNF
ncbi:MAG: porin [Rhodoferax sp.]|nr:porin [Rhodoferax sp.]